MRSNTNLEECACNGYPSPDMGRVGQVINMYVEHEALSVAERAAFSALVLQLPPPMQHGIRTRVWRFFYPSAPYPGIMIGMRDITVIESSEILIPYDQFEMGNVPWSKI